MNRTGFSSLWVNSKHTHIQNRSSFTEETYLHASEASQFSHKNDLFILQRKDDIFENLFHFQLSLIPRADFRLCICAPCSFLLFSLSFFSFLVEARRCSEVHSPFSSIWMSPVVGFSLPTMVSSSLTFQINLTLNIHSEVFILRLKRRTLSREFLQARGQRYLTTLMRAEGFFSSESCSSKERLENGGKKGKWDELYSQNSDTAPAEREEF